MTAQQAVLLISALDDLEENYGTRATRLKGRILQNLSDTELVKVAVELKRKRDRVRALFEENKSGGVYEQHA